MSRNPLLIFIGITVAVFVLAVAAFVLTLDRRADEVWREVIPEANRMVEETAPVPGSFAAALKPLLPELTAWRRSEPELPPAAMVRSIDVELGLRPWEELPSEAVARLERGRELMRRVMAATHARSSGMPMELTLLSSRRIKETDDLAAQRALQEVVSLVAWEIRRELSAGRVAEAASLCLEGLTLSREQARSASAHSGRTVWRIAMSLYRPCADAVGALPEPRRTEVSQQLRALRSSLPSPSQSFRAEAVNAALVSSGVLLSPAQLEQLAPALRPVAEASERYLLERRAWWLRPFAKESLARRYRYHQALAGAADLEPAAREHQFELFEKDFTETWSPVNLVFAESSARSHAQYAHEQAAVLDTLIAMVLLRQARERDGRWPESVPELFPAERPWLPTTFRVRSDSPSRATLEPTEPGLAELFLPLSTPTPP